MRAKIHTKLPFWLLVLAWVCSVAVLDGCRGRKKNRKKKAKTSWRQRLNQASVFLEQNGQPSSGGGGPAPIVNPTLSNADMPMVIREARSYTGTPYLSGGTTRAGMDCSGLVATSYQAVNYTVPRISYQQAEAGPALTESQLAPGDLVFFTDHKGGSNITHVGIVTEVRDKATLKFIHASTSLGVVENNLRTNYWKNLFVKGVRIR